MISRLRLNSHLKDYKNIVGMLDPFPNAELLDLGCQDGRNSLVFANRLGTAHLTGVDKKAYGGYPFTFLNWDVEKGLPFDSGSFDVITAIHIIEHISNTDLLTSECFRLLREGGYILIATPNMASGKVILELILNKQPDNAHVSDYFILRGDPGQEWKKSVGSLHKRLFTVEGLSKLLTSYGFKIEKTRGTGYGPFILGGLLRGRYASNIIVKARK